MQLKYKNIKCQQYYQRWLINQEKIQACVFRLKCKILKKPDMLEKTNCIFVFSAPKFTKINSLFLGVFFCVAQ